MTIRTWTISFLALVLAAGTSLAQNLEPPKYYKLDFVVKETEAGKVLNSRNYSITLAADGLSGSSPAAVANNAFGPSHSIRSGSRVPVRTTKGDFTFIDLGVNIDCRQVREVQNGLSLSVTADVTSTAQEAPEVGYPVLRQNKWTSNVLVPIKKPTLLFSSDDVSSKRQMQLELTATPIK